MAISTGSYVEGELACGKEAVCRCLDQYAEAIAQYTFLACRRFLASP